VREGFIFAERDGDEVAFSVDDCFLDGRNDFLCRGASYTDSSSFVTNNDL
jgi:hypothetical protein